MDLKNMTEEELQAAARAIREEEQSRIDASFALEQTRMREGYIAIGGSPAVINMLCPTHSKGRYGRVCTDDDLSGGRYFNAGTKDWHCKRCLLLEAIADAENGNTVECVVFSVGQYPQR